MVTAAPPSAPDSDLLCHFCDDPGNAYWVLAKLDGYLSRKYQTPYDSKLHFETLQIGRTVYFSGGGTLGEDEGCETYFDVMMKHTILKGGADYTVDKLQNMQTKRADHTMVALVPTKIYSIGGINQKGALEVCEVYSTLENKWVLVASLNEKKKWPCVVAVEGKHLYCFFGSNPAKEAGSELIEYLDPADKTAKTWKIITLTGPKPWAPRLLSGVVELEGGIIMIIGGIVSKNGSDDVFLIDHSKKTYCVGPKLEKPDMFYRTKPGVNSKNVALVGSGSADFHIYDKATKKWKVIQKYLWYGGDRSWTEKADTF